MQITCDILTSLDREQGHNKCIRLRCIKPKLRYLIFMNNNIGGAAGNTLYLFLMRSKQASVRIRHYLHPSVLRTELQSAIADLKTKKRLNSTSRTLSWWSCRESHPGPSDCSDSHYKFSLPENCLKRSRSYEQTKHSARFSQCRLETLP